MDLGSGLYLGHACLLQLAGGLSLRVGLLPGSAVAPDFKFQFFAESVNAGHTHSVQSTRNFVRRGVEFSSCVQLRHYDLGGRNLLSVDFHVIDRDAASVIDYSDGVISLNRNFNLRGIAGQRFVYGIVDNFVHQMMKSHLSGRSDVHSGALAHRFHPAEDFNRIGVVVTSVRSAVSIRDGGDFPVFCFSFDGSIDFFCGHSAPRRCPDLCVTQVQQLPGIGLKIPASLNTYRTLGVQFKLLEFHILRLLWDW